MTKTALFAGTFDPPSNGHLDIIQRAAKLFDSLIVAVALNPKKKPLFSIEKRVEMLKTITQGLKNVTVVQFDGLVIEHAKKCKASCLIRGLRTGEHLDHEFQMAFANRRMSGLETLFLMADESHAQISSSLIREILLFKGSLDAKPAQD